MAQKITDAKLDFWLKNDFNVLMEGRRGVGKSSMILAACQRNGIKAKYFSAATMDPFTDFVGTPYKAITQEGVVYIDYIRPLDIEQDTVELMIFDEYNRAKPKIRNAVMELIQFKKINGRPFKNLRMVWAAVNPETDDAGDTYNVEPLDPAERDRFHVIVQVPYETDNEWFIKTYGEQGKIAVAWWDNLSQEFKNLVSPRRLEYTIKMYNAGGDLTDVLPPQIPVSQLVQQLKNGSYLDTLRNLMTKNEPEETKKQLRNETFYAGVIQLILDNPAFLNYFCDYIPKEKFNNLLMSKKTFRKMIIDDPEHLRTHKETINEIVEAGTGAKDTLNELRAALQTLPTAEKPNVDNIKQLYPYLEEDNAEFFDSANNRLQATAALTNVDYSKQTVDGLKKGALLTLYIGARTFGKFWGEHKFILERINEAGIKLGYDLAQLYTKLKTEPMFKKLFADSELKSRLENRLREERIIPDSVV